MLTTITPYWGREDALAVWLKAIEGASLPEMKHIIFFVGGIIPDWVIKEYAIDSRFHFVRTHERPGVLSIGHYHNEGAKIATTPWMMKLDVDAIPHVDYFKDLLPVLQSASPRQWFNGGMIYLNPSATVSFCKKEMMPLRKDVFQSVMRDRRKHTSRLTNPEATNFICRTGDYLKLGGCDIRFRGWGWEDYQQIYMLERYQRGKDPLPGMIESSSVSQRCRDEISRPKALSLWTQFPSLCLLHRWHPSPSSDYKSLAVSASNKQVLLDYIIRNRK